MSDTSRMKEFFGALYEKQVQLPQGEYDETVTKLVVRTVGNTVVGDQALQSLLTSYVAKNATSLDDARSLGIIVAGIKQRAVDAVAKRFPKANLETLIAEAKEAGLDVQVLGRLSS